MRNMRKRLCGESNCWQVLTSRGRQHGFTLTELLVALVLGAFLISGVLSVFLGGLQTFRMTDSLSRIQESGRFALEIMRRDLRQAGYYGCLQSLAPEVPRAAGPLNSGLIRNTLNPAPSGGVDSIAYEFDFSNDILGYESTAAEADSVGSSSDWSILSTSFASPAGVTATGELPATGLIVNPLQGRDIIVVSRAMGVGVAVNAHATSAAALELDTADHGFEASDVALVTDCNSAAVFQITGVSGVDLSHDASGASPGNYTAELGRSFSGAEVMEVSRIAYYVANSPVTGRPALYRNNEEIAENVERLQLRYGEDISNDRRVDEYREADAVDVWDNVLAVRIDLLISSGEEDNLTEAPASVAMSGEDPAVELAADNRLYRAFSATVGIRNRVP